MLAVVSVPMHPACEVDDPPAICCPVARGTAASEQGPELFEEARHIKETWTGQPIKLPMPHDLLVIDVRLTPGVPLPVHRHPYPRFGWVKAGEVRITQESTGRQRYFRAGDLIAESVDDNHFGEAVGSVPVVLKVLDVVPCGTTSNTILRDPPKPK
ncbi:hypothetical protein [Roseateles sp. MS654]|uniref:hypothetical protein n=1 Tax=Roseateles sp. MS654 TaxID=3412685 RepID=UPI003C2B859D